MADYRVGDASHQSSPYPAQSSATHHYQASAYLVGQRIALENFLDPDELSDRAFKAYLNRRIEEGVSLYSPEDQEGFRWGYRCSTLLKAVHLLVWLNKMDGGSIRKCQPPGCPDWFQAGSQGSSVYCPPAEGKKQSRCASRATSKAYRERQRQRSDTGVA